MCEMYHCGDPGWLWVAAFVVMGVLMIILFVGIMRDWG